MISAIEWVPAGVADPNPKKYEFSEAEQELIKMMEEQKIDVDALEEEVKKEKTRKEATTETKTKLPTIDPSTLPADLRMDEYSSDEDDDNDAIQGTAIGKLLVEDSDAEEPDDEEEEDMANDSDDDSVEKRNRDGEKMDDDYSDDSDDDLADVPDTREYTPIDLEGLTSLGLSHVGTNAPTYMGDDDEEDDSDAEDVQLQADDALVVVAKTEDVSVLQVSIFELVPFLRFLICFNCQHCAYSSRILLPWKFTCMSKKLATCLFIMIFRCLHFRFVWPMETFRLKEQLATFAPLERFPLELKSGTWMS